MSDAKTRLLLPGDEDDVEAFLSRLPETSMFLRGNLRAAGLLDRGRPYQGTWAGAERDGAIVAVAALFWSGVLVLQAPERLEEVVGLAVREAPRPLQGVIGPWDQVLEARALLGLDDRETALDSKEDLLALRLSELRVPPPLADGRLTCVQPGSEFTERLVEWQVAYRIEETGATEGQQVWQAARATVARQQAERSRWLLLDAGAPVTTSTFNAQLPDCVQIGGVFTPPALRSRGYARAVVAGSLLAARARGVCGSVLFTGVDNHAARRAYEAIGFRWIGDYGLFLLREPVTAA